MIPIILAAASLDIAVPPYAKPTPDQFKIRYPGFANVDVQTIQYWLNDALRFVDQSWSDQDYAPAIMARAAHSMVEQGIGVSTQQAAAAAGLTRWRSGSADLQFSEAIAAQAVAGGLSSTKYGREYLALLRRRGVSMGVTSAGSLPCYDLGFNGFAGPMPGLWR